MIGKRMLTAASARPRRPAYRLSIHSVASTPAIVLVAAAGMLAIASEQTWRTALFAVAIAAAIAATRVRFALHAAALLLVVLAVLAAAGVGVGGGSAVIAGADSTAVGQHSNPGAKPPAERFRSRSTRRSKHHPRVR